MGILNWFKRRSGPENLAPLPVNYNFLGVDFHNHILPGVDDGSPDVHASLNYLMGMAELGIHTFVLTPHIHSDLYPNKASHLKQVFENLQNEVTRYQIPIQLHLGAEYLMDNHFLEVELSQELLHFGKQKNILFEFPLAGLYNNWEATVFKAQSLGYQLILAHPERYLYIKDLAFFEKLKDKGVHLQMNSLSIFGYYGSRVRTLAEKLLANGWYDYMSSDLHHERHLAQLTSMWVHNPQVAHQLLAYQRFKNHTLFA
jgi:protein-tyrosine phosphatase